MKKHLFEVTHKAFVTDHIEFIGTIVEADDKEGAEYLFNQIAAKRRKHPYMWSDASSIELLEVLTEKDL